MLHRDIRPSNIMITEDGVVKIIDFGCGKLRRSTDTVSDSMASIVCHDDARRLPDEMFDREYDAKTDMFFLGEMFDRLISGSSCEALFRYGEECRKMASPSALTRYPSFQELQDQLSETNVMRLPVSTEDTNVYSEFAQDLCNIIANRDSSSEINVTAEVIISGLDSVLEENLFAKVIQNPCKLIDLFINGDYRYFQKNIIEVSTVKAFREWFGVASKYKQDIIVKSLRAKLGTIKIIYPKQDDVPF